MVEAGDGGRGRPGPGVADRPVGVTRTIVIEGAAPSPQTRSTTPALVSAPPPERALPPIVAAPPAIAAPRGIAVARAAIGAAAVRWATPLRLGGLQGIFAVLLVLIELASPRPQEGLRTLTLSNAVGSEAAQRALAQYRLVFDPIPVLGHDVVLSPAAYVWGLRAVILGLVLLQLGALLTCLRGTGGSFWRWAVGPTLTTAALLAYPPVNTDVFFYASTGFVGNAGRNPYLTRPDLIRNDPFVRFHDWGEITSPYGPLWTRISQALVGIADADPIWTSLAFKAVSGVAGLALGGVAYLLARRLTDDPRRALGVFVLVAWQPALLAESAATAHHDAVLTLLAVAGLLTVTLPFRGAVRLGLVLVALSAMVKPVTLPLLGLAGLWRLRDRRHALPRVLRQWAGDAVAILLAVAAVAAPYWDGTRVAREFWSQSSRLYVDSPLWANPLWFWIPQRLGFSNGNGKPPDWLKEIGPEWSQRVTFLLLLGVVLGLGRAIWRGRRGDPEATVAANPFAPASVRPLIVAWALAAAIVALVPVNAHAWYAIWPVAPVALVWATAGANDRAGAGPATPARSADAAVAGAPRLPWWLAAYLAWSAISFLVYHTLVTA